MVSLNDQRVYTIHLEWGKIHQLQFRANAGMSLSSELKKDKNKQHIAVIGDGSMTGGINEGLNHGNRGNQSFNHIK